LGGDNALAIALTEDLGHKDGEFWRTRRVVEDARIEYGEEKTTYWLQSIWRPWADTEVESWLVPPQVESKYWHLRVHRVSFKEGATRDITLAEGGFATYGQGRDGRAIGTSTYWSSGSSGFDPSVPEGVAEDASVGSVLAASKTGVVGVIDLTPGNVAKREVRAVKLDPNSNIVFSRAICPSLVDRLEAKNVRERWYVTGVFGLPFPEGRVEDWEKEWNARPTIPKEILVQINSGKEVVKERTA
jgi:hypothetical protein